LDYTAAINYIKNQRSTQLSMLSNNDIERRDMWLINTIRGCISKDIILPNGERRFEYDCKVPDGNIKNFGQGTYKSVCRKTFQLIYGISKYEWELVTKRFKEANSTDIYLLRVKTFSDQQLHEYSYREGEQILEGNLLNSEGKFSTLAGSEEY